jgi:hypothetical protein
MSCVGCYSLDLYCDCPDHFPKPWHGRPQGEFIGETFADCARQAREKGWIVVYGRRGNRAVCPKCSKKRRER